ncbi:unnamed protein product [marine sediment metagenome]|uniref:Uncharacterized protein n=1 Tax=marine sediment metagenome TaxID=412755 RepID=X1R2R5_9ZZZZ
MKIEFLGFQGNRQNHQDWALEIIPETGFEKTFFSALFASDRYVPEKDLRQMQPIAALLCRKEAGITVMVSAENFCESALVKARKRIAELEQAPKDNQGSG